MAVPADFETFWKAYPKRVKKHDTLKIWKRMKPSPELLQVMLTAIETAKQSRQWKEGYVNHPSVWLNGKRWLDEFETNTGAEVQHWSEIPKSLTKNGTSSAKP